MAKKPAKTAHGKKSNAPSTPVVSLPDPICSRCTRVKSLCFTKMLFAGYDDDGAICYNCVDD
jgi:hypothetical protein